jgi:hypothetical protein
MGMRSLICAVALTLSFVGVGSAGDGEKVVEGRIVSAGLFKNGLAAIKREVTVPGPGVYRLDDVPAPVHGTFWIESDTVVHTRITTRRVERPLDAPGRFDYHASLVGSRVDIRFRDGAIQPVSGMVLAVLPTALDKTWSRKYQEQYRAWYGSWSGRNQRQPGALPARILVLDTGGARAFVDVSQIAYLQSSGDARKLTDTRPSLVLDVKAGKTWPATIHVTYLAKGLCWAPSYRVDLSKPDELTVAQKAVIRNELTELDGVEVRLISGFPNIPFSHVTSPMAPSTNLTSFFDELSRSLSDRRRGNNYLAMSQQAAIVSNFASTDRRWSPGAASLGAETDMHYQPIGRVSMLAGDTLMLPVAEGKAAYERIVEWIVPDMRAENGRYVSESTRRNNPEVYDGSSWDAVRFENPLPFAMTTAPAMFLLSDGRFGGQTLSRWVGRGEETTLRVTKSLSVQTRCAEHEEEGERKLVYVFGNRYRKSVVKGTLIMRNHRKVEIKMTVRRRFSGIMLSAEGEPESLLLGGGVMHVNPRRELTWTLTLKPGEEKKIEYRYEVLVDC